MALNLLFSGLTTPGTIVDMVQQTLPRKNYFLVNEDLDDDNVEVWGTWLFRIYVPGDIQRPATFESVNLFTNCYAKFDLFPLLQGVQVQMAIYAPERSAARVVSLYVEE